jgi:hypothetical protein
VRSQPQARIDVARGIRRGNTVSTFFNPCADSRAIQSSRVKTRRSIFISRSIITFQSTRFREIEVALNAAQRFVVDDMLIAQTDDGLTFGIESFLLKMLILRCRNSTAAIFVALGAEFELR